MGGGGWIPVKKEQVVRSFGSSVSLNMNCSTRTRFVGGLRRFDHNIPILTYLW